MKKQTIKFSVEVKNGVVSRIGRSAIYIPKTQYNGAKTKWFDDTKLIRK